MRNGIILTIGAMALLVGCGNPGNEAANVPVKPKAPKLPYNIEFDTQASKPNPAGVTIPPVKYKANPDVMEKRAILVVRFDASAITKHGQMMNWMIMAPVDMAGAEGTLPADYMDAADKDLARFLGAYCAKGKMDISVALARSSLNRQAGEDEVNSKLLTTWLPTQVAFKNPHPKC